MGRAELGKATLCQSQPLCQVCLSGCLRASCLEGILPPSRLSPAPIKHSTHHGTAHCTDMQAHRPAAGWFFLTCGHDAIKVEAAATPAGRASTAPTQMGHCSSPVGAPPRLPCLGTRGPGKTLERVLPRCLRSALTPPASGHVSIAPPGLHPRSICQQGSVICQQDRLKFRHHPAPTVTRCCSPGHLPAGQ